MPQEIHLDMSHLFWFMGLVCGLFLTAIKVLFAQVEKRFDEKFAAQDGKFVEMNSKYSRADLLDADSRAEIARVERSLMEVRLEMSESYVKESSIAALRTELATGRREISESLRSIDSKLDSKISREECGHREQRIMQDFGNQRRTPDA